MAKRSGARKLKGLFRGGESRSESVQLDAIWLTYLQIAKVRVLRRELPNGTAPCALLQRMLLSGQAISGLGSDEPPATTEILFQCGRSICRYGPT